MIEWETPKEFFDNINREFSIDLDVCARESNAKVYKYIHPGENALEQTWYDNCWMNPPYDKTLYQWVKKAVYETQRNTLPKCKVVVCLLPAKTDTKWFHEFVMKYASEIRFVADRIHFGNNGNFKRGNHASMLVIFKPVIVSVPIISEIDRFGRRI